MSNKDIWKSIPNYEGLYEFNGVDVRSVERTVMRKNGKPYHQKERILKWVTDRNGRNLVNLKDGTNGRKTKTFLIHQLIWMWYNEQSLPEGYEIHHIDGDFNNNSIDNLQLLTKEEHLKIHGMKVVQALDAEGKIVYEFQSTNDAGRNGFGQGHVCRCCNGRLKTHKGYFWRYA